MNVRYQYFLIAIFSAFLFASCSSGGTNFAYDSLFDVDLSEPSPDAEAFIPDGGGSSSGGTSTSSSSSSGGGDDIAPCIFDPFGDGGSQNGENGLAARLYYMNPDPTQADRSDGFGWAEFFSHDSTHQIENRLILSQINRPTVGWETGFEFGPDQFISFTNEDGDEETLVEWFGFLAETKLKLTASDPAGDYEFAILSDDGVFVDVLQGGVASRIISNDGIHSTKLGCGSQTLNIQQGQELDLRLSYYQGPRVKIAFVLLWRTGNDLEPETSCGNQGDSLWFDGDSQPKAPYNELLSRGWEVIPPENFLLPDDVIENPCEDE